MDQTVEEAKKSTNGNPDGLPIAEIMGKCNDMVAARLRIANATLRRGILRRRFAPFAAAKKIYEWQDWLAICRI